MQDKTCELIKTRQDKRRLMGCKMVKGKKSKAKASAKSIEQEPLEISEIDIEQLSRKELQTYCKRYGIKANGKTSELQESLKKLIVSKEQTNVDENQNEITSSSDNIKEEKYSDLNAKPQKTAKSKSKQHRIKTSGTSKTEEDIKDTKTLINKDTKIDPNDDFTTNSNTFNSEGENDAKRSKSTRKIENDVCRGESSSDVSSKFAEDSFASQDLSDCNVPVDENHGCNYDIDTTATINASASSLCDNAKSFCDEIISVNTLDITFTTNNSFLNQTFSKSQNLTPCVKKQNATFILEKIVDKDQSINEPADSTSEAIEDDLFSSCQAKSTSLCIRWCVVEGLLKHDSEVSWKLMKLKGGRPVVPNRFGKYIQFVLEPSVLDVPPDFKDNFICGSCVKENERVHGERQRGRNPAIPSTSETNTTFRKEKENTTTPLTAFTRDQTRASVKRKRVEEEAQPSSVEEPVVQTNKRQRKVLSNSSNKNPASPMMRKARGETLDLPRNHKKPWRPKRASRSSTPVNVSEDALFAEKVEAIIQTTVPGSEEELQMIMATKSRVQRSPKKT